MIHATPTAEPAFDSRFVRRAPRGVESRSLDALYEAGKILSGPADPTRMLSPVLNVLSSFMGLRGGAVALLVEPEDRMDDARVNPYVIAATTLIETPQPPSCGAIPPAVAATVFKTGVATVIQNAGVELGEQALPRSLNGAPAALLAVPIRERSMTPLVLGVLAAWRVREDGEPFALDQDLRVLSMVANLMAQSLRFRRMVARDRDRLMAEARQATKALEALTPAPAGAAEDLDIIGDSAAIRAVAARIRKIAPTRSTVLLRGESGTGKELFARAIHRLSDRRDRPFVKVNCAALSETLLESELFGHEKGSFTGAMAQKKGRFELADGGTLFLDEIGEISPAFQSKLLRALQEGEFERVGGSRTVRVDVRLVCATNKDLEDAVAKGEFRADLYFRICVIPIVLPPLRERPDDIPRLAEAFLSRFNAENGTRLSFGPGAVDVLRGCFFPGNVRELENCVNRVAALAAGPSIDGRDLACQQDACLSAQLWRLQSGGRSPVGGLAPARLALPVLNAPPPAAPPCAGARAAPPPAAPAGPARGEREALVEAMERAGWVQAKAARLMGMTPRQIGYALKKHGVDVVKL
jgi:Nif-specific regulatory protein